MKSNEFKEANSSQVPSILGQVGIHLHGKVASQTSARSDGTTRWTPTPGLGVERVERVGGRRPQPKPGTFAPTSPGADGTHGKQAQIDHGMKLMKLHVSVGAQDVP